MIENKVVTLHAYQWRAVHTEMCPNEPLTRDGILEYKSKVVPMAWVAITSGF